MNFSLKPGNAPKLFVVRIVNATVLTGGAAGSLPELDIDVLRTLLFIAASDLSPDSP